MDAEIYGMTPSAKIDTFPKAPPENILSRLRASVLLLMLAENSAITDGSMPGSTMKLPRR